MKSVRALKYCARTLSGLLYFYFDSEVSSLGGVTIMGIFGIIYTTWDAMKYRKKIKHANLSI